MIQEVKPNIFLDYLGGEFPCKLFEKMPSGSIFVSAGCLSLDKLTFDVEHL